MSSMRLILAAAVLAGVAMAAPAPRGCADATATNDLYDAPTATCAAWANCTSIACGGGATNGTLSLACLANLTTALTCATAKTAAVAYVGCLNAAAMLDSCQPSGTQFGELGMALAGVMSASEYAGSNVQASCARTVCRFMNASGLGASCLTELGANDSMVCMFEGGNDTNTTPPPAATPNATSPPAAGSGAASVSTAVLAVLATVALLL
jgi:hypothetical protein